MWVYFATCDLSVTQVPIFGQDRLVHVLFESLFRFVHNQPDRPLNMATRYFHIFPDDIIPVWTVSGVVMGRRGVDFEWCGDGEEGCGFDWCGEGEEGCGL